MWKCPTCENENADTDAICQVCSFSQPMTETVIEENRPNEEEFGQPEPKNGKWICPIDETETAADVCPVCGGKRPEPNADWECPDCGWANQNEARYCAGCGKKRKSLHEKWVCSNCKTENDDMVDICCQCAKRRYSYDWVCPKCGVDNHDYNSSCRDCGSLRPGKKPIEIDGALVGKIFFGFVIIILILLLSTQC